MSTEPANAPAAARSPMECGTSVPLCAKTSVSRPGAWGNSEGEGDTAASFSGVSDAHGTEVPAESGAKAPHSKTRRAFAGCGVEASRGNTGEPPVPLSAAATAHPAAAPALIRPPLAPAPRRRARIEIIPLIDVIFFLLATFVLFTLALNRTGGLAVKLPAADTGRARDDKGAVTVTITAQGALAWDKIPVTPAEFLARLAAWKTATDEPRILINGDASASFQQVRYVVDEIRKAGITQVHIETKLANR